MHTEEQNASEYKQSTKKTDSNENTAMKKQLLYKRTIQWNT